MIMETLHWRTMIFKRKASSPQQAANSRDRNTFRLMQQFLSPKILRPKLSHKSHVCGIQCTRGVTLWSARQYRTKIRTSNLEEAYMNSELTARVRRRFHTRHRSITKVTQNGLCLASSVCWCFSMDVPLPMLFYGYFSYGRSSMDAPLLILLYRC